MNINTFSKISGLGYSLKNSSSENAVRDTITDLYRSIGNVLRKDGS